MTQDPAVKLLALKIAIEYSPTMEAAKKTAEELVIWAGIPVQLPPGEYIATPRRYLGW